MLLFYAVISAQDMHATESYKLLSDYKLFLSLKVIFFHKHTQESL